MNITKYTSIFDITSTPSSL